MPTFTRTNGGAQPVVATGSAAVLAETTGVISSVGVGKPLQAFGFTANASLATQMGTGEAVEQVLGIVGQKSTVLAYQVDTTLLSVVCEEGGWDATDLEANANAAVTAFNFNVSDVGLKLATS